MNMGTFSELFMTEEAWDKKNGWWRPGLYIHILEIGEEEKYVDYVGKVIQGKLIERQIEHYRNLCGGICCISKDIIKKIDKENIWPKELDWVGGVEKDKLTESKKSEYLKAIFNREKVSKRALFFFDYANKLKIYFADMSSISDKTQRKTEIETAEKILISKLSPLRNLTKPKKNNEGLKIEHRGELNEKELKEYSSNNENISEITL